MKCLDDLAGSQLELELEASGGGLSWADVLAISSAFNTMNVLGYYMEGIEVRLERDQHGGC
jgi:hypothetical protein